MNSVETLRRRALARPARTSALLVFVIGFAPLALGRVFVGLDFSRLEVPLVCELQRVLSSGDTFWLSKTLGGGGALFAHAHAQVLYPLRWATIFLAPEVSAATSGVLHLVIAAFFATLLARVSGARRSTSIAAGVTFACSGIVLDLLQHSSYIVGAAWVPACLFGARAALSAPGPTSRLARRATLLVGVSAAMLLLGGEPQALLVAALFIAVFAARALLRDGRRDLRARALVVVRLALAGFGGALIGMLLWAPALADFALGRRSGAPLPMRELLAAAFPFEAWPALVVPGLFRATGHQGVSYAEVMLPIDELVWNLSPFVAAPLVVTPFVVVFVRRARTPAALALFTFLCAAGASTPLLPTLYTLVPPLAAFRYPAKLLVPACLMLVVTGALVADRAPHDARVRRTLSLGSLALAAALMVVVVVARTSPHLFDEIVWPSPRANYPGRLLPYAQVLAPLFAFALIGPLAGALVWSRARLARFAPTVIAMVTVFHAKDAVLLTRPILDEPALLDLIEIDTAEPVVVCALEDAQQMLVTDQEIGFDHAADAVAMFRSGQNEMQACYGFASPVEYSPAASAVARTLEHEWMRALPSRVHRALGCDLVFTSSAEDPPGFVAREWRTLAGVDARFVQSNRVVTPTSPVPHAFVIDAPVVVDDDDAIVRAILTGEHPTRIVDGARGERPVVPKGPPAARGVEIRRASMADVTLDVDGEGPGVVVVRQSFRVGFTATQGDVALPVVRVGGMFVGAVVDDLSRGPIRFSYRPRHLSAALVASLVGLCLLAALARPFARRERRAGPES